MQSHPRIFIGIAYVQCAPPPGRIRIRIFVDFWNFVLSARRVEPQFMVDWKPLGQLLTLEAGRLIDATAQPSFEGMHVYGSFDPAKLSKVALAAIARINASFVSRKARSWLIWPW
jgi:hypothetical protein